MSKNKGKLPINGADLQKEKNTGKEGRKEKGMEEKGMDRE